MDPPGHGRSLPGGLGRGAGLGGQHLELPAGCIPDQLEDHVVRLAPGLLDGQAHQQGPDVGGGGLEGPVEIVATGFLLPNGNDNDNPLPSTYLSGRHGARAASGP